MQWHKTGDKHLHNHVIDAEILSGSNAGYRTLIPRIKLAPSDAQFALYSGKVSVSDETGIFYDHQ